MTYLKKLTTISLCITLSSCGEKKTEDTVENKAKAAQEALTHDSVYQDLATKMEEMSKVIATIKDLESAKAAIPSLTKLGFQIKMSKSDLEKLGPAAQDFTDKLAKEYEPKMTAMKAKIGTSMEDLKYSHPDAFIAIDKVMKTIME